MSIRTLHIDEPALEFHGGQRAEDPRDGLTLFGPLDEAKPAGIRMGLVGTPEGIDRFLRWHGELERPVRSVPPSIARPTFPGFKAAFGAEWQQPPVVTIPIDEKRLNSNLLLDDKYQRVYQVVNLYADAMLTALREEDTRPDLWFAVIPDEVKTYCRPRSSVSKDMQVVSDSRMKHTYAKSLHSAPSLFEKENIEARPYQYQVNFHNQLKARLLASQCPVQILLESTVAYSDILNARGQPKRDLSPMLSDVAWHISTTTFYKSGGRPWRVGGVRSGVCYIGMVFKQDERYADPKSACCAAQMFLDSGDGMVFKGDVGPWYNPRRGEYHLNRNAASELIDLAVRTYEHKTGSKPTEIFVHGKVRFRDEEWAGFKDGAGTHTNVTAVRIRDSRDMRFFTWSDATILRGSAVVVDKASAFLWTRGVIPRLRTYPGREVPRPLEVLVSHGDVPIEIILQDIMGLTKLNYNACRFSDGYPVTLKFAEAVGEILTAGPIPGIVPLPFKHYI
jgi:hypothetical protein